MPSRAPRPPAAAPLRPAALAALAALAAGSSACRTPPSAPPRPATRGVGAPAAPGAPAARTGARAFRATSREDLARGPNASGRLGDFVLENRFVRAVIDDVTGGGGFALSGGQLVDLALRDVGEDELGQVFNYLGRFPRQLRYTAARTEARPDGTAAVVVTGDDPRAPGLSGETAYSLGGDDRALTLTTTLTNRGAAPAELGLGDAIQWAGAEHWAPGLGFAMRGERTLPYIAGVGARVAYAIAAPATTLFGPNGSNWSDPMQRRVTLAPGESVTYTRRIGVARGGDVTAAVAATGYVRAPQRARVRVVDRATRAPVEGVRVLLRDASGAPAGMGASDAQGVAVVAAEPGVYAVDVVAPGRAIEGPLEGAVVAIAGANAPEDAGAGAGAALGVDLAAGAEREVTVALGPASALAVRVLEGASDAGAVAVPARVLVYGVDGTPDPYFGAAGRADGARNTLVVSHREPAVVPLAPGRYRVVATRGTERSLAEARVEVAAGRRAEVALRVARVVDTTGYVCGDFHSHQAPSLDSPVAVRDRVRAAAAEGLEVLAATDHNVATDLAPAADREGLSGVLLTLGSVEVSTDVALAPAGHWNLYPIPVDPDAPVGGAPRLFDLDPAALVRRAREVVPGAVIQVNHPRSGAPTGAFDIVGFDPDAGRATRGNLDTSLDAIEIWNGRFQPQVDVVLRDWLAILRSGARPVATANSDSHTIVVQEIGYPRTCLRVPDDAPGRYAAADVVRAIRETRDVVLTDGPFLRVEGPDGRSAIGRVMPAPRGLSMVLRVRVESPVWSAATVLEVIHPDGRVEPVTHARWETRDGVVRGEAGVRVDVREAFVIFRARGTERIPVLLDDPALYPLALTNPVFFR